MTEAQPVPVVIGTAGHIDHGKSALVEALCGTHPDRWQEEQERGITIDLGYAQLTYADGLEIGFVDVPGHEKLVRKMVAGATGMGAAMLVVASDDGVMTQTREHFEVLTLLGVDRGIVVISKADLADEDTMLLVEEEVHELIEGSSWENAQVVAVSSHAGTGLEELREALRTLALDARSKADPLLAFRMPVQRSFAIQGAGTVATGVCASGTLDEGQEVVAMPSGKSSRVRRVQVHGRSAGVAEPGLRTALNLPDLTKVDCDRGVVLVAPGSTKSGKLLRMTVSLLPDAPVLKHDSAVQILAGTSAVEARIFFGGDQSGTELFVDIEAEEEICLVPGQRCLLRRPSPAKNFGVARFLGFGKYRLKKRDAEERKWWQQMAAAIDDREALLLLLLETDQGSPKKPNDLASAMGWTVAGTTAMLDGLVKAKRVQQIGAAYIAAGSAQAMLGEVLGVVDNFRGKFPGRLLIPIQRFRDRLGKQGWKTLEKLADEQLETMGVKRRRGTHWELLGVEVPEEIIAAGQSLLAVVDQHGLTPPDWSEVVATSGLDADMADSARGYLVDSGQAVQPIEGLLFAFAKVNAFREAVVAQLESGGMDIPALRDQFQTTRKFVMPLLEYLDDCGVTERRGPNRLLRDANASLL
ncbi:MAG: selenocysteine-specific translation elongation factor [Planctomycetes bacterium]|nr:selenocysteine-specific translation elongation factor [Planctomycetota bacterium]MCP4771725.1 selenocysteine-specific translation elongation factor [Planctomycetota bacterium]MCP4859975.1 selenocysteine-specific translation elongation factor [Planctomycetota bacterium]